MKIINKEKIMNVAIIVIALYYIFAGSILGIGLMSDLTTRYPTNGFFSLMRFIFILFVGSFWVLGFVLLVAIIILKLLIKHMDNQEKCK